jgi:hypothetical protein
MRLGAIVVAIAVAASGAARADDLGLHGDLEAGLIIGGARIHDSGGMLSGVTIAAGGSWHDLSLLGTFERDDFIPTEQDPSVAIDRFGWRARYDLQLNDDELGKGPWRSKWSWYFDAGAGEQLIHWDATNSRRADFEGGTGFSLLVYDPHQKLLGPPWGLSFGFELTSAPALPAIAPAGVAARDIVTAGAASGRENAYLFTFSCRLF